jgi:hypothetical protein
MTIYSVHIREKGSKPDLRIVPDGFSWGAALFGFVWAFYIGAWDLGLLLILVQTAAGTAITALIPDPGAQGVAQVGLAILIGFMANEMRRTLLMLRGMNERGVVTGSNIEDAERRYFDNHPDLTVRLLMGSRL